MLAANQPLRANPSDLVPLLTAEQVRAYFGGISSPTLYRWINDPELNFPQPRVIQRRKFWRSNEIEEFANKRAKAGGASA